MNKTAIKNFAIWARNKLITDISYRAGLMGITADGIQKALPQSTGTTEFYDIGTAEPYSISGEAVKQRNHLVELIRQKEKETNYKTAYKYVLEEVAYTWFNRLIAVRFMEVNDYLPSHIRVLSSDSGKLEPDLVTTPFDAELAFSLDEEQTIYQLKRENKIDEVFRILFIKQCNALNEILPALFEKTSDYTELLLNLSVIDQDGVVYHLVHDIPEEDFDVERGGQVEIIGWLYQYYNTEPKNEAFGKNGKFTKEEVPAATQLFTPDWIVRYMVENSLGRLWLEGHPNDNLKAGWKYYLEEVKQEPDVQAKLSESHEEYAKLKPEDIKVIDPCMGSGHILVYAFDVLMQIYESAGYGQRDAVKSILENNLYGLDIDDRAFQMAYFAVMMKAREYNRRILSCDIICNLHPIKESNRINRNHLKYLGRGMKEAEKSSASSCLLKIIDVFRDAKEYGSIINVPNCDWELIDRFISNIDYSGQLSFETVGLDETCSLLSAIVSQAKLLSQKYNVAITNPPYMSSSGMNGKLSDYVKKHYPDSKADMFAVFIEKCMGLINLTGYTAMITQHAWMFINSYESLRYKMLQKRFTSLVHLGIKAFEEIGNDVVQTCAFVIAGRPVNNYATKFVRLVDCKNYHQKEKEFLAGNYQYSAVCNEFKRIPGVPIAYWVSHRFIDNFAKGKYIEDYGVLTGSQNITGDNETYLKLFWEIASNKVGNKWRFYAKGGDYRQYYGNLSYVVDWSESGRRFYATNKTSNLLAEEFWFKPGVTYSAITSRGTGFRYLPEGCIFDKGGPSIILRSDIPEILALLNTNVAKYYFWVFNPSINLQVKDVKSFPIILTRNKTVISMAEQNLEYCRDDWNSVETSWEYTKHPLLGGNNMGRLISDKYKEWAEKCDERFNQLKANEEELNRIFIEGNISRIVNL